MSPKLPAAAAAAAAAAAVNLAACAAHTIPISAYDTVPVPTQAAEALHRYLGPDATAYPGCAPEAVLAGYRLEHSGGRAEICASLPDTVACHAGDGTSGIISIDPAYPLGSHRGDLLLAHEALHAWLSCARGSGDGAHADPRFCAMWRRGGLQVPQTWGCSK